MPRYIDADEAIEEIDEWLETVGVATLSKGTSYYAELKGCIEDVSTTDVQEVKHGKWINRKDAHTCSCCKEILYIETHDDEWGSQGVYEYCPYCGARMDGDEK